MGTNYYALEQQCAAPCDHCSQDTEWHIGKSLVMFEAHETSPWGKVEDWADWKRILASGVRIRDEYGVEHDPAEFVAEVEATTPINRSKQYRWVMEHGYSKDRDYLDSHGFSWHRGEFF